MTEQRSIRRRTALRALGTVATTLVGVGVAAGADGTAEVPTAGDESTTPGEQPAKRHPEENPDPRETGPESGLTGIYGGTVDRVVGGEHVVVLIETDEETIGQEIVPAAEFPSLEARDSVIVWMLFGTLVYLRPV